MRLSRLLTFVEVHNSENIPGDCTKEDILRYLGKLYEQNLTGRVDGLKIAEALIARERLVTTGVGYGLALPNAKVNGLDGTYIGIYRLSPEMDWQSMDKKPVDLVIPVIAPNNAIGAHLNVMARLSYILKNNEANRERLRASINPLSRQIDRKTVESILNNEI